MSTSYDFYQVLQELLRSPDISSVAYRYAADDRTFRLICEQQTKRAKFSDDSPMEVFAVHVLNDGLNDVSYPGAEVVFWDEGIGYGDLYVDLSDGGGCTVKELFEKYKRPAKYILTLLDFGEIRGYEKAVLSGCYVYKYQPSYLPEAGKEGES